MKKFLILIFFSLGFTLTSFSQSSATGEGYYAGTWNVAKIHRQPIENINFWVQVIIDSPHGVMEKSVDLSNGAKFTFTNLPYSTNLKFKICQKGGLSGTREPICYEYDFTISKGVKEFDLGSFVYLVDEKRWVPLKTILNH